MNKGKLEVVKQEMARVNINILGISELKWTGMLLEIHIFDIIKVNYNGKFYCIPLSNETTHDNIMICCNDKDMAVHMAKSVKYKNVFPEKNDLNNTLTTVKNITGDLQSKANKYTNNTNLSNIKSTVEEETGVNLDNAKSKIEQYTGKLPI